MMIKIGLIGMAAVFLALPLKKEKGEFALLVVLAAGLLLFFYVLAQMLKITDFLAEMAEQLPVGKTYLAALLKMLGIAYIADYVSTVCREAGFASIGNQLELFAKLSIVALGIPELRYLLEVIGDFL
jgi:stage III sporulation protein AD